MAGLPEATARAENMDRVARHQVTGDKVNREVREHMILRKEGWRLM